MGDVGFGRAEAEDRQLRPQEPKQLLALGFVGGDGFEGAAEQELLGGGCMHGVRGAHSAVNQDGGGDFAVAFGLDPEPRIDQCVGVLGSERNLVNSLNYVNKEMKINSNT